jgi:hypothetical protein
LQDPISTDKLGVVAHVLKALWVAEVGGSWLKANPVQKCVTLSEKITKTKRAGDMVQVVELLPGKP